MIQLERRENYGRHHKISIHCIIFLLWNWHNGWVSHIITSMKYKIIFTDGTHTIVTGLSTYHIKNLKGVKCVKDVVRIYKKKKILA